MQYKITSANLQLSEVIGFIIEHISDEKLKESQIVMKKINSKAFSEMISALQSKGIIEKRVLFSRKCRNLKSSKPIDLLFVILFLDYCMFSVDNLLIEDGNSMSAKEIFCNYPFNENVLKLEPTFVLRACSVKEGEMSLEEYYSIINASINETNSKIVEITNQKKIENYSKMEEQLKQNEIEFENRIVETNAEIVALQEQINQLEDEKKKLSEKVNSYEKTMATKLSDILKIQELSPDFPFPKQMNQQTLEELYQIFFQRMSEIPIGTNDSLLSDYLIRSYVTLKLYQREVQYG